MYSKLNYESDLLWELFSWVDFQGTISRAVDSITFGQKGDLDLLTERDYAITLHDLIFPLVVTALSTYLQKFKQ